MNDDASLLCHVNLANGFRGGERQTLLLMKALSERGFLQKLIARKGSELSLRSQSMSGIDVIETNMFAFDVFANLPKKTLLHFHDSRAFPALFLYKFFKEFNYIYTRRVQRKPKVNFISKKIYRDAKKIVCLSSSIEDSVKNIFVEPIDLIIIPSAYAGFKYEPEKSLKIKKEIKQKFIVGHIGVLDDSHKGQLNIIEAARESKRNQLDIGFILVGSGRDESILKEESKDLDNIYYVGQVENIGDYLKAFDIFIFPSRHEGLGSSLLDAMNFGLPIIASKIGGIRDIIEDGFNGFLVDPKSSNFFEPLRKLYEDDLLRKRISDRNKDTSREYSIERMTKSYLEIYNLAVEDQFYKRF